MVASAKKKSTSKSKTKSKASSKSKSPLSKKTVEKQVTAKTATTKKTTAKKSTTSTSKKAPLRSKTNYMPTAAANDRMKGPSAASKQIKKETKVMDKPVETEIKDVKTERFTTKSIEGKKIKILAEKNPKRPSSKSFEKFELYKNGMLATTFIEKGGRIGDLKYDVINGHIGLEG